jgi:hypothetical protein
MLLLEEEEGSVLCNNGRARVNIKVNQVLPSCSVDMAYEESKPKEEEG